MTSELSKRALAAVSSLSAGVQRRGWQIGLVAAAAALSAMLGFGLVKSLLPLLAGNAALAGALVGAVVAAGLLPLALWARVPPLPRKVLAKPSLVQPLAQPTASVTPLHAVAKPAEAMAPGLAAGSAGLQMPDAQRSARDALTGAYTQQHFVAAADREWSRIRRHGEDAALLMIDIDRLNGINERFGQPCGDALLVEITRQVSTTLRQYDLLSRFGGGVLVVYLPHTDPIGALDVAERIRERVAGLRVTWETHTVRSTVSVGVAGIGASHGALDEVIADAGAALREAKAAGRNCVRAAPIPPRRSANPGFPIGAKRPAGPL